MTASEDRDAFAWGPDRRQPRTAAPAAITALVVLVVLLLAAGIAGAAIHKDTRPAKGATLPVTATTGTTAPPATAAAATTTAPTPAGFQRLVDKIDHLSLAVPTGWQAPAVTNDSLAATLQAMKAKNPTLAALLDNAIGALAKIQVGVFALDTATRTTLFSYGMDVPGVTSAEQISTSDVVKQVQAVGGKNVHVSLVPLPVGTAGQVTAVLTVNKVTIAEALDYLVVNGRLISIVVSTRGTTAPLSVLRQIELTLAPA